MEYTPTGIEIACGRSVESRWFRAEKTHLAPLTVRWYPTLLCEQLPPTTHSPKTPKTVLVVPTVALRKVTLFQTGGETDANLVTHHQPRPVSPQGMNTYSSKTIAANAKKRPGSAGEGILVEVCLVEK